jgi:hypothetical protein
MEALTNALPGAVDDESLSEQEILANLNDDERTRFLAVRETFETDGWRILQENAIARGFAEGVNGANAGGADTGVTERCARAYGARNVWQEIETWADTWYQTFENVARQRIEAVPEHDLDDLGAE